jgi:serralysin
MSLSASGLSVASATPPPAWVDEDTPSLSVAGEPTAGTTVNGKTVWTEAQIIANLERNNDKWAGAAPVITYQFYNTQPVGFPFGSTFAPLTDAERTLARQAFFEWGEVANVSFVEASDNGVYGGNTGRVSLFLNSSAPDYEWGDTVTYTRGLTGSRAALSSAEIAISPSAVAQRQLFVGGYNFQAMMHEIGHSLGLPHPGDYNANGSTITYANSAEYFQDSNQYTIMSYFSGSSTGANFVPPGDIASYSAATPLRDDIAAIQAIYGANMTTRAGDTTYGFNSNTDDPQAFDFTVNTHPIVCIWDAGGNNTIDMSGSSYGINLDLHAGAFSDVMGMVGNLSIAFGTTIQNAVGSSGNDTIVGNDVANALKGGPGDDILEGNGGDDTLDGGTGTNTALYASAAANYDWWWNAASGTWTVDDGRTVSIDGKDTLISIQKLQFSDQTIMLAVPTDNDLIAQAFTRVLSSAPSAADTAFIAAEQSQHAAGETLAAVYADVAARAAGTTAVAVLSYEFFTGVTPSKVGLDYLVDSAGANPNNLNSAYYQSFSTENRFINFAVNLGKLGDGAAAFTAAYGALSLADATSKAYATIFGATPTADKVAAILNAPSILPGETTRADYFAYYGQDGASGIGTKAAMVGYLLAQAVSSDLGTYAKSDDAYLAALGAGTVQHVDLVGAYAQPGFAYTGG